MQPIALWYKLKGLKIHADIKNAHLQLTNPSLPSKPYYFEIMLNRKKRINAIPMITIAITYQTTLETQPRHFKQCCKSITQLLKNKGNK